MNGSVSMPLLMARIQQLETGHRNCKRWVLTLAVAIAALPLLGLAAAHDHSIVDADGFNLRDEQGRIRGELAMTPDGPRLRLLNTSGGSVAELAQGTSGPTLKLVANGKSGGQIEAVIAGGQPTIRLYDSDGGLAINLVAQRGEPVIKITDANNYSAALGSTELKNAKTGQTHRRSAASIILTGKEREVIWSAGR